METLLPHNEKTLSEVEKFINKKQNVCVVNPCGSGKTNILTAIIKNHKNSTFIIITKQKNAKNYYIKHDMIFNCNNVKIITYNKITNEVKNGNINDYKSDFLVIDEAHYMGAPVWHDIIDKIRQKFNPITIGLTATPQRYEDRLSEDNIVTQYFRGNYAGNFTNTDLYEAGVFKKPDYFLALANMNVILDDKIDKILQSDIDENKQDELIDKIENVRTEYNKTGTPEIIIKKNLHKYLYKQKCNRILVYTVDTIDIKKKQKWIDDMIKKVYPEKTLKSYIYTYQTSEDPLTEFLTEDSTDIKILYTIDKIMETIHIDDLSIEFLLRPSVSNRIITQQLGRINNMKNKNTPLIIDMVDNASNLKENFTANDFIDIKKGINRKETGFNINIPCFKKFKDIFYEVDKLLLKDTNSYTYKEFRGNLSDICHIYLKDKNAVDAMIENGIEITVAIDNAPLAKIDFRMPKYENTEIKPLTTDEKTFMNKTLPIVNRYIKSQPIKNEDISQEIYASYIEKIPEFVTKNKSYLNGSGYISGKIYSICKNIHKQAIRKDNIRKLAWNKYDEFFTEIYADRYDTTIESAIHKMCADNIHYILQKERKVSPYTRITEKEMAVLKYRYVNLMTLEQVGKIYDVNRERIRQIEAKALRKLRCPSRRGKLKHYIEFYNNDYHNEQKTPLWDLLVKKK